MVFQSPRNRVNTSNSSGKVDFLQCAISFNPLEIGSTLQMELGMCCEKEDHTMFQSPRNRVNTSNKQTEESQRRADEAKVSIP